MRVANLRVIPVAVHAFGGRIFVNDNLFFTHEPGLNVALVAGNVGMPTGQGEMCASVVVEGGRHPALDIVAIAAMGLAVLGEELTVVGIVVAGFALLRSSLETRFVTGSGFMAFTAGDGTVCTDQWKLGFGMIEAVDVCPGLHVVAGFAAEGSAVGALASHAIVEFILVRILVASGAISILEVIGNDLVCASGGAEFMAFGARDSDVGAGEREAAVAMLGDGVCGAMEILHRVAGLAGLIRARSAGIMCAGVWHFSQARGACLPSSL